MEIKMNHLHISAENGSFTFAVVDQEARNAAQEAIDKVGGNSIFYTSSEVGYTVEEPEDGGISFNTVLLELNLLSNGGVGIKKGDIIVASNGTLCKVTNVSSPNVSAAPIGTISGIVSEDANKEEIVQSVLDALPTWTGGSF